MANKETMLPELCELARKVLLNDRVTGRYSVFDDEMLVRVDHGQRNYTMSFRPHELRIPRDQIIDLIIERSPKAPVAEPVYEDIDATG